MNPIAFLGTGMIGSGLVEAAIGRGAAVTVWNRTPEKTRKLVSLGARAADGAGAAVKGATRVHLALSDDTAVDAVLEECMSALDAGVVVVDHTTTSPAGTVARAAHLEARSIAFVHAPVFMSPLMCREAKGVMLAAAPKQVFERVKGELEKMTGALHYLGERRDLAAANKLFGNAMIFAITAGLADVYAMAAALDIPATDAHALFSIFNPTGVIAHRGAAMARGSYEPSFELSMARKDARLMLEAAGNRALTVLPSVAQRMDALIGAGHANDDLGVLSIDAVPKS